MTEQIDVSSQISKALTGFFDRMPDGGSTGNCLGPIRVAKATARVGEMTMEIEAFVMSDIGPEAMISTADEGGVTTYYNCAQGRWAFEGGIINTERADMLCGALAVAGAKG